VGSFANPSSTNLDMNTHSISNVTTLNGKTADNLVTNAGTSVTNNVATFSGATGKVIQDGLVTIASLLSRTMTGAIDMGAQEINDIAALRPTATNVIYGRTASAASTDNVVIGEAAVANLGTGGCVVIGSGALGSFNDTITIGHSASSASSDCVTIGHSATSTSSSNVVIGSNASSSASKGVAVGAGATCADNGVTVGRLSTSTANFGVIVGAQTTIGANVSIVVGDQCASSAAAANIIGSSLTNATANSLLIAASANVRASTTTCDLGTVALPFQTLRLNSSVAGPSNSRLADDIVSNTATGAAGNVPTFVSAKVIGDSGTALSSLATTTALALKANAASPTFTGTVTTPSVTFNSTSGIIGTTTNNSAAALSVGEFVTSTAAAVGLTTGAVANLTSISLTAGDWDVWGTVGFTPASTATVLFGGINSTSATLPGITSGVRLTMVQTFPSGQGQGGFVGQARFSLSATTTVYLVLRVDFASTCTGDGYIGARRVR
jgi:hypothetical protein